MSNTKMQTVTELTSIIDRVEANAKRINLDPIVERDYHEFDSRVQTAKARWHKTHRDMPVFCNIFANTNRNVWTVNDYIDQLIALKLKGHIKYMSGFIAGTNSSNDPRLLIRVMFHNHHIALLRFTPDWVKSVGKTSIDASTRNKLMTSAANKATETLRNHIDIYALPQDFVQPQYFSKNTMHKFCH